MHGEGSPEPSRVSPEDERLAGLMEIILAVASGEAPPRATVLGDGSVLDGIATGLNMMSEELAERRAREAELQRQMMQSERLAAVGQLAAGVAHEINNPAAFILSNLEHGQTTTARLRDALKAGGGAPTVDGLLAELSMLHEENLEGLRRIIGIARTLLGFVRLQPDRVGEVALDEVARQALTVVAPEIRWRAKLVVSLGPVPRIAGDHDRLVQVVTNLLLNAVQALPAGAGGEQEIEVGTRVEAPAVILWVRDTGTGIPPEVQARIFEPFFTTKPRGVGTGLGLPISAEIARTHGGALSFVSTPGQGTTFELRLPMETGMRVSPPPGMMQAAAPVSQGLVRLLLIDDEPAVRRAYKRMLDGQCEVHAVESAEAALELLKVDQRWDALLCDLVMPGLGGDGLYRHLEEHHPRLLSRTIFCTGGAFTPGTRLLAERLGERVLHKPVDPAQLREALRRVASGGLQ